MSRSRVVSRISAAFGLAAVALVSVSSTPAHGGPEVVRLHISPDGSSAAFTLGAVSQSLTPTTRCLITGTGLDGPLVKLSSNKKVGMSSNGIGIKTGGSQGTPCGRTDTTETLSITTAGTLAGRLMHKLVLDVELKGNALVELTLTAGGNQVGVFELQTGSSIQPGIVPQPGPPYMALSTAAQPIAACASPSDSGPDSGANDNCLWTVDPGADFDTATFTTLVGEFSLEGSGDFGGDPTYDTLLHLSNRAPIANDDGLSTPEDTQLSANVLSNDSDPDTDPIMVTAIDGDTGKVGTPVTLTPGGTVTVAADGALAFTPTADFNGAAASFEYTITDSEGATATATVQITVTAVNDPPVATASSPSVDEDDSVIVPIATDVENDPLTVTCTDPANGSVVDNGDGSITYTPDPDFNGADPFDCTASDGPSTSNQVTISATVDPVNDAPVAADDAADTDEDAAVVIDVLANDTDIDGDTLMVSAVTDPPNGTAQIAIDGSSVTYTPDAGFLGVDTFDYDVSDGNGGSDTATVTVETFEVICSNETVTTFAGSVAATITRFGDSFACKRFVLVADPVAETLLFQPADGDVVEYRAYLDLGSDAPPALGSSVNLFLEYDPEGGDDFRPVPWCDDPTFDPDGNVTSATIPGFPGETWCIASAYTRGVGSQLVTTWQTYGKDDPKFR